MPLAATSVALADGTTINARRAVIADVVAPKLYRQLLVGTDLPDRLRRELDRYQPGSATFKVNWALSGPVPWADPEIAPAGTVHLAASLNELSLTAAEGELIPDRDEEILHRARLEALIS